MSDKSILDEHTPDWESMTAMQMRQAVQAAPSSMRGKLRAAWSRMLTQPPAKSVKSTKGKTTTKSKKEG